MADGTVTDVLWRGALFILSPWWGTDLWCNSTMPFKSEVPKAHTHPHTHKQQTDELFRMCFVFVGSRLGDSQPACIQDVVWHSRQRVNHMRLIWTWRANRDSRTQFFIRNLCVWRITRTKRDFLNGRGLQGGGYLLKTFLPLPLDLFEV